MIYVVLSDIHGNLEAFQSVMSDIEKIKPDKYIFLGDSIGYCANPNECIELLNKFNFIKILGNHEYALQDLKYTDYFNPNAREALIWTSNNISKSNMKLLSDFKIKIEKEKYTLVHANPVNPEEWAYISSLADAKSCFEAFNNQICFLAHSHIPWIIGESPEKEIIFLEKKTTYKLEKNWRYLINAGSVGQPRDHDSKACYLIWNTESNVLEFKRVKYDIISAYKKIIEAKLPVILAERLKLGV